MMCCHWTIPNLVTVLISYILMNLTSKIPQILWTLLHIWTCNSNTTTRVKLHTRWYDKRDDFDFTIVNFPHLSSNIPSSPAHGVYISQLIRYSRACSHYNDFLARAKVLTQKLLRQQFLLSRLKSSFKKFYGQNHDLVDRYKSSVTSMMTDLFIN